MAGQIFFVKKFGEHGGLLGKPESSDAICLKYSVKCKCGAALLLT